MTDSLTRSDLAVRLSERLAGIGPAQAEAGIKTVLEALGDALARGDRVEIRGFGSFCLHVHPPKQARNPKTGETFLLGIRRIARFRPGKELRNRVDAKSLPED